MRRFTIAGVFSLALVGVANAQFFDPPALADRNGSQGFWFYMLEVPDPVLSPSTPMAKTGVGSTLNTP